MKKLIFLFLFLFLFIFIFTFYSFSSFSISDGCIVVLNFEKPELTFEDLVFTEGDKAQKCTKENTFILKAPGNGAGDYEEPQVFSLPDFSFTVVSLLPEKREDELTLDLEEVQPALDEVHSFEKENNQKIFFLSKVHGDIALFFIKNDLEKESSGSEIKELLFQIQSSLVQPTIFFLKNYEVEKGARLRANSYFVDSERSGLVTTLVFSKILSKSGEKMMLLRSINTRLFDSLH